MSLSSFSVSPQLRRCNRTETDCCLVFCVNSILYQRGVYPEESFKRSEKYGIPLMLAADPALKEYLAEIMKQVGGIPALCIVPTRREFA